MQRLEVIFFSDRSTCFVSIMAAEILHNTNKWSRSFDFELSDLVLVLLQSSSISFFSTPPFQQDSFPVNQMKLILPLPANHFNNQQLIRLSGLLLGWTIRFHRFLFWRRTSGENAWRTDGMFLHSSIIFVNYRSWGKNQTEKHVDRITEWHTLINAWTNSSIVGIEICASGSSLWWAMTICEISSTV